MRKLIHLAALLAVAVSPLVATAPLPRKSPEFAIYEPGGKTILLSNFKGKVVVIEFLFVGSQHCLRVATTINRLHSELGSRGFQPVGIAFGPNASGANAYLLAQTLKLTYPLGYASKDDVDSFLARGRDEVLNIPQVVVIDRAGMIRAQSGGKGGNPILESEDSLRSLIEGLLKEGAPPDEGKPRSVPQARKQEN
jgi:peroxiredoxin